MTDTRTTATGLVFLRAADLGYHGFHDVDEQPGRPPFRWTGAGDEAQVRLESDLPPGRVRVEVVAVQVMSPSCWNDLTVSFDGLPLSDVDRQRRGGHHVLTGTAAVHPIPGGGHVIEMRGPLEVAGPLDPRLLGVGIGGITIEPLGATAEQNEGTTSQSVASEATATWQAGPDTSLVGLHAPEPAGRDGRWAAWTGAGPLVRVDLQPGDDGSGEVEIEVEVAAVADRSTWDGLTVGVDGADATDVDRIDLGDRLVLRARGRTPERSPDRPIEVTLRGPTRLAGETDARHIGVALRSVRSWPATEAPARPAAVRPEKKRPPVPPASPLGRAKVLARRVKRVGKRRARAARDVLRRLAGATAVPTPGSGGSPGGTPAGERPSPLSAPDPVVSHANPSQTEEELASMRRELLVMWEVRGLLHDALGRLDELEGRVDRLERLVTAADQSTGAGGPSGPSEAGPVETT